MNKIKEIFLVISFFIFVSSCGAGSALAPKKKSGADEFLVKKKSPLVMPPSYGDLPEPIENDKKLEENNIDIKKLLTGKKSKEIEVEGNNKIESLILNEINKKN